MVYNISVNLYCPPSGSSKIVHLILQSFITKGENFGADYCAKFAFDVLMDILYKFLVVFAVAALFVAVNCL